MTTLSSRQIQELLIPYYPQPGSKLVDQLYAYLELLLKWNARMNLTAIRDPEDIVTRHFGESLFTARHLPSTGTLLDVGSGAGFPGVPIQLVMPGLKVTLAESQNKKSTFLRELIRVLGVDTEVWAGRVEDLPVSRMFDVVTLRAVDSPETALNVGHSRVLVGGVVGAFDFRSERSWTNHKGARFSGAIPGTALSLPNCSTWNNLTGYSAVKAI